MKILRRRVRSTYLWGAIVFVGFIAGCVKHPEFADIYGSGVYYGALSVSALLAVLYGAAWLTTRKPSPYRNNWAVGASSLSLVWGMFLAFALYQLMPGRIEAEIPALITILVSGAGIYLYAPGGTPAKPELASEADTAAAAAKYVDLALPPMPPSGRKPSVAPTPIAPSLAALSASSPEMAAAAAAPGDSNAPWDPLSFIRTADTLQKMRG